ncbi:MAG: ABC transporter permease [Candidatus Hydrogenedentes bacterium]|nr:ABC transporter permease [Candidatus Hydrogenedentota bacterium]
MNTPLYDSTRQRDVLPFFLAIVRGRELLMDLVRKDLRARYRYTALGFLWTIFQPLALMIILTFVFKYVIRLEAAVDSVGNNREFAVTLLCGLIFWQFFAEAINNATHSMLENQNLINKTRLPREVIPLAAMGYPLVNCSIGFLLLVALHLFFGGALSLALLWLPAIFGIQLLLVIGLGFFLSCTNVIYRDVGYIVGVALLFGFYASPIFYELPAVLQATESGNMPSWMAYAYLMNPLAELFTAYRQILFESRFPDWSMLIWPVLCACGALLIGVITFRKQAATLSDHL